MRTEQVNLTPGVKKPARFRPVPRPKTAVQRARERLRDEKLANLAAQLLPDSR